MRVAELRAQVANMSPEEVRTMMDELKCRQSDIQLRNKSTRALEDAEKAELLALLLQKEGLSY